MPSLSDWLHRWFQTPPAPSGEEDPRAVDPKGPAAIAPVPTQAADRPADASGGVHAPPDWTAGEVRRLGRYLVGPKLGSGGMGEVFEAWDTLLRRPLALKLLHVHNASHLIRFVREAQLQARVDHPNICRVFDAEVVDGTPLIAMRLVRGPNLSEAAPSLSQPAAVAILRKVCEAMHAAHRLRLVHRDLKPANILLERNDLGGWEPFITDFGLAKDLSGENLTRTHAVMGTPAFMAPEQSSGQGDLIGPATDIYALGVTLRETLKGGSSSVEGPTGEESGSADPQKVVERPLPRDLQTILDRCLEERPADRYPHAAELAEDLRRFQDGEPLLTRPVGVVGRWTRRVRKHPWAAGWAAAALLIVGGLLGWNRYMAYQATQREQAAQRFISRAMDLEYRIRIERMRPPHDLRPALRELRTAIETMKGLVEKLGPSSRGPGQYAMGRAYLTLREHEKAFNAFQTAWTLGYRTPEVAYSLGRAHCELFSDQRWGAFAAGEEALQALKARHLNPARIYFTQAVGQSLEPASLGEAHLALLEDKQDLALSKARQAQADQPSNVEGFRLEAAAWYAKGFDMQYQGRYPEAERFYQAFESAMRKALDLARSDEASWSQYLDQRLEWAYKKLEDRSLTLRECDELVQLSDRLLELDTENPLSIAGKLNALNNRANHLAMSGKDPRPDAELGLALARTAEAVPDPRNAIGLGLMRLLQRKADYEYNHGIDPRPAVLEALRKAPPGEDRVEVLNFKALWELEHGLDPMDSLSQIREATLQSMKQGEFGYHHYYLGNALRLQGEWEAMTGKDPTDTFSQALDEQRQGIHMNPEEKWCWIELARTRIASIRYATAARADASDALRQALTEADKAVELGPESPFTYRTLADVHWMLASQLAGRGQDPSPHVTAGLQAIQSAIQRNPNRWYFHLTQARLCLVQARFITPADTGRALWLRKADLALARGEALQPRSSDLCSARALWAYLKEPRPNAGQAARWIQRALAINPRSCEANGYLRHGIE